MGKASTKVNESIISLIEAYQELVASLEQELGIDELESEEDENESLDKAVVAELRHILESVIEVEEYGADEIASLISNLGEALEEIAPEAFTGPVAAGKEDRDEDYNLEEDDEGDYFDDDFDDEDLEDDEVEEESEEIEEE